MKVGDKVKFLNDTGGGEITRFLGPEKVLVMTEDGFEVPTMLYDLILDRDQDRDEARIYEHDPARNYIHPENHFRGNSGSAPEKTEDLTEDTENSNQVYFAFLQSGNPYKLKSYLINDTNDHIYYVLSLRKMNQDLYQHSGHLKANTKIFLDDHNISDPDEQMIFSIQYISYKPGFYTPRQPCSQVLTINTRSLAVGDYNTQNDFFDEPASLFSLTLDVTTEYSKSLENADINNIIDKKEKPDEPIRRTGKEKQTDLMEVDLHIHEIVDDEKGLSNGEILNIQLRRFETALETALRNKIKKVVFIHGLGQGKLKYEIQKKLNDKYPDLRYQDASFKEYGYGATMVIL